MTDADLEELERLAKYLASITDNLKLTIEHADEHAYYMYKDDMELHDHDGAVCNYYNAANPVTILSLITQLREARGKALVDEEALAKWFAKYASGSEIPCDIGISEEYVRCIREIKTCKCAQKAKALTSSGILIPMATREALVSWWYSPDPPGLTGEQFADAILALLRGRG